jgi:flavin reductase (DIM6/NTAB) family NADH-FMN oxidoreductase RutF
VAAQDGRPAIRHPGSFCQEASMPRKFVPLEELNLRIFHAWNEQWFLLTAGEKSPGAFNSMTVAWGSLGIMWGKPLAMVVVRPQRYTYEFMEKSDSFTLCAFPMEQYRDALNLCGSRSGREIDKAKACNFTPIAMSQIKAPGFDEAELILECRKIYHDDFDPARFLVPEIQENYAEKDYHRMYFGEVLAAWQQPKGEG